MALLFLLFVFKFLHEAHDIEQFKQGPPLKWIFNLSSDGAHLLMFN